MSNISPDKTWLVFGCGSPERRFLGSRFNVGSACLELLVDINDVRMVEAGPLLVGESKRGFQTVIWGKANIVPEMVGDALMLAKGKCGIDRGCAVILYGDPDLKPGQVRMRSKGAASGNKLVEEFLATFGKKDVVRIRVGIGHLKDEKRSSMTGEIEEENAAKIIKGLHIAATTVNELIDNGQDAAAEFLDKLGKGKLII